MKRHLRIIATATLVLVLGLSVAASAGPGDPVVRPGAKVTYLDTYCTMNFVFKGSDGNNYVGSAGHCPLDGLEGTSVWAPGDGLAASDASGVPIGEFAFASFEVDNKFDFSLVRLNKGVRPDPQVEYWGGPTRMNQAITYEPEFVKIYGHGLVISGAAPQRQLLAPNGFDDKENVYLTGASTPGDSGAPAITESGEALGILVSGGLTVRVPEQGPPYPGFIQIVRLPLNVTNAERILGIDLKLMSAPVLEP